MPQPPPSPNDVAQHFPEAVQFARAMREAFGDDLRMFYARNQAGQELKGREPPALKPMK